MLQAYRLSPSTCFTGQPVAAPARARLSKQSRRACVSVRAENVLIANTKGGGHAFIGLHLAKQLLGAGHSVTIFNDGDPVNDDLEHGVRVQLDHLPDCHDHAARQGMACLLFRLKSSRKRHTASTTAWKRKASRYTGEAQAIHQPFRLVNLT